MQSSHIIILIIKLNLLKGFLINQYFLVWAVLALA